MPSSPFVRFAETAEAVAATASKLRKRDLLGSYLSGLPSDDVPIAATFFAGRPLPGAADKLGLGWVQHSQALAAAAGADEQALYSAYLHHSDLGDAAAELLAGRDPSGERLTLADVDAAFRAMSEADSTAARVAGMTDLYRRAPAGEARFVGRIAARELRIGLREGLLEEAIAAAFERPIEAVRRALMLVGEPGEAAALARDDRLDEAALHLGRPIRFMLATPVADSEEVMRRVGSEAWIEDKYDGIRAQLHLAGAAAAARLFSRDLNEITISFPEVAAAGAALDRRLVIDGELVPYRAGSVLDFASLQTRLGRVDPGPELLEQVPVVLVAFDLLHLDGRDLLETPLRERRAALEALRLPELTGERFLYSHLATARSAAEVESHFDDARERRNEGLMVKDPASVYQPGRRGLGWLKLKKALATLDCVVVGVEWGHGKRRGVLSDYTFAVRGQDGRSLRTIGKAYTGLTDAEIAAMTEHFGSITLRDFGRYRTVVPEVVVEIAFDRIMRSARHTSGFAMRFPRIVRIRADKTAAEIDDLATVEKLFAAQASGRILLARGARGETERISATGAVEAE